MIPGNSSKRGRRPSSTASAVEETKTPDSESTLSPPPLEEDPPLRLPRAVAPYIPPAIRYHGITNEWPHGVISGDVLIDMIRFFAQIPQSLCWTSVVWMMTIYIIPFVRIERTDAIIVEREEDATILRKIYNVMGTMLSSRNQLLWVPGLEPTYRTQRLQVFKAIPVPNDLRSRLRLIKMGPPQYRGGICHGKFTDMLGVERMLWQLPGSRLAISKNNEEKKAVEKPRPERRRVSQSSKEEQAPKRLNPSGSRTDTSPKGSIDKPQSKRRLENQSSKEEQAPKRLRPSGSQTETPTKVSVDDTRVDKWENEKGRMEIVEPRELWESLFGPFRAVIVIKEDVADSEWVVLEVRKMPIVIAKEKCA